MPRKRDVSQKNQQKKNIERLKQQLGDWNKKAKECDQHYEKLAKEHKEVNEKLQEEK